MALIIWSLVTASLIIFGIYAIYASWQASQDNGFETGQAILRFGKAFPMEAIREVIMTKNRDSFFLRLHGGRTGCIVAYQKHAICRILEPGSVQVHAGTTDDSIAIEFGDRSIKDAVFVFRSAKDAAEVSLWLLGSLLSAPGFADVMDHDPTGSVPGPKA